MFWRKPKPPLTQNDQEWVEDALLWIADQFGKEFLRTVSIKTPTTKYFDRKFTGMEEDADFALGKICEYMSVDRNSIYLSFYGHIDLQEKYQLLGRSSNRTPPGTYKEWPEGYTEISLHLKEIHKPVTIIATLAHEVAQSKLLGEKRIAEKDQRLADLTALAFGFGIFLGNSAFEMHKWQYSRTQGWSMKRRGYLPEPIMAYTMAWIAEYQGDKECTWLVHLNKTMASYFKESQAFIRKNPDKVRFERKPGDAVAFTAPVYAKPAKAETPSYEEVHFPDKEQTVDFPMEELPGKWDGEIIYGPGYRQYAGASLYFNLEVKSTKDDEFEGIAVDTNGAMMNVHPASIKGVIDGNRISFAKVYSNKPKHEVHYYGSYYPHAGEFRGNWEFARENHYGSGTWKMQKVKSS